MAALWWEDGRVDSVVAWDADGKHLGSWSDDASAAPVTEPTSGSFPGSGASAAGSP
jgi:hypothetical protein